MQTFTVPSEEALLARWRIAWTTGEIRFDTFLENLLEIVWNSSFRSCGAETEVGLSAIPRATCGGQQIDLSWSVSCQVSKWALVPEWSRLNWVNWVNWASAKSAVHPLLWYSLTGSERRGMMDVLHQSWWQLFFQPAPPS